MTINDGYVQCTCGKYILLKIRDISGSFLAWLKMSQNKENSAQNPLQARNHGYVPMDFFHYSASVQFCFLNLYGQHVVSAVWNHPSS